MNWVNAGLMAVILLLTLAQNYVECWFDRFQIPGCLALCVAPLVNDVKVREILQNATTGATALVELRFRDGITAGEIPSDFPVAVRASQLIDFVRGLTMRALLGIPRKTLLKDAEEVVDLVLLPRRGNAVPEGSV